MDVRIYTIHSFNLKKQKQKQNDANLRRIFSLIFPNRSQQYRQFLVDLYYPKN